MKRFLENGEDEILLHQGRSGCDASQKSRLQAVIDRVSELGLSGKEGERKSDK
jgi:hypothetical protein